MNVHIQGNLQDMVVELGEACCGDAHGGSFLVSLSGRKGGDETERGGGGAGRGEELGFAGEGAEGVVVVLLSAAGSRQRGMAPVAVRWRRAAHSWALGRYR